MCSIRGGHLISKSTICGRSCVKFVILGGQYLRINSSVNTSSCGLVDCYSIEYHRYQKKDERIGKIVEIVLLQVRAGC